MKKFITVAALLAAGTAFSNAAEQITTDAPSSTVNYRTSQSNGLYGFEFTLSTASISGSEGTLSGEYILDSLRVVESNNTSSLLGSTATLAIYKLESDGSSVSFVAASADTTTASTRIYDTSGGFYSRNEEIYSFTSDAVVDSDATYLAVFFLTSTFDLGAVSGYSTLSDAVSASTAASLSLTEASSANIGLGVFTSAGATSPSTTYAPILQATLTAIPEPSAFGLLAGVGALALVAARRRRSK